MQYHGDTELSPSCTLNIPSVNQLCLLQPRQHVCTVDACYSAHMKVKLISCAFVAAWETESGTTRGINPGWEHGDTTQMPSIINLCRQVPADRHHVSGG